MHFLFIILLLRILLFPKLLARFTKTYPKLKCTIPKNAVSPSVISIVFGEVHHVNGAGARVFWFCLQVYQETFWLVPHDQFSVVL